MLSPKSRKSLSLISLILRFPGFFGNAIIDLSKAEELLDFAQKLLLEQENTLKANEAQILGQTVARIRAEYQELKEQDWHFSDRAAIRKECKELRKDAESAHEDVKSSTARAAIERFNERALERQIAETSQESTQGNTESPLVDFDGEEPSTPGSRLDVELNSLSSLLATVNPDAQRANLPLVGMGLPNGYAAQMSVVTFNSSASDSSCAESNESPIIPVAFAVEVAEQAAANISAQIHRGVLPPGVPSRRRSDSDASRYNDPFVWLR